MATERRLEAIPPQSILSNGSDVGRFAVPDASLFKVKQLVKVFSDVDSPATFQVKLVIPGFIYLGAQKTAIDRYSDLSQYTTANNTKVSAEEQERPPIIPDAYNRAMYEEEPVVAKRSILVDKYGRKIDESNPLPTTATISGDVTIGTDGFNLTNPDSMLSTGSEDGTETGIKHAFVNNFKSMILASHDRVRNVIYLDLASKKNRRVDKFEYTSATFPGITLVRQFNYSLQGSEYIFINDNWTLI